MKLYYTNKIIINGLFPMKNFKIDGYSQKTGIFNESVIDKKSNDYIFYHEGYLTKSSYSVQNKEGAFYEYFENIEPMEIEIISQIKDKKSINNELLTKINKKVKFLEKKLRLITNLKISLPMFLANVYDESKNLITSVGASDNQSSLFSISKYTIEMKELLKKRLNFYISDKTLLELEEKNIRFKRASTFFINSFIFDDISIRFILLVVVLESLFNTDGEDIIKTLSKYGSKILFLNCKERHKISKNIRNYYLIRSNYIHGNTPLPITKEIEFDLRELVREILLIYWYISTSEHIFDANNIIKFLDNKNKKNLDLNIQLFIKAIHVTNYKEFYNKINSKIRNNDYNILSDKSF